MRNLHKARPVDKQLIHNKDEISKEIVGIHQIQVDMLADVLTIAESAKLHWKAWSVRCNQWFTTVPQFKTTRWFLSKTDNESLLWQSLPSLCKGVRLLVAGDHRESTTKRTSASSGIGRRLWLHIIPLTIDDDSIKLLRLADEYPIIHSCIGIHPWHVHQESLTEMINLIESAHKRLVGIGEIGLDYAHSILEQSSVISKSVTYK